VTTIDETAKPLVRPARHCYSLVVIALADWPTIQRGGRATFRECSCIRSIRRNQYILLALASSNVVSGIARSPRADIKRLPSFCLLPRLNVCARSDRHVLAGRLAPTPQCVATAPIVLEPLAQSSVSLARGVPPADAEDD